MKIYKVWFYEYDEEGKYVIDEDARYFADKAKAEAVRDAHKEDAWTGKAHIEEIEVE